MLLGQDFQRLHESVTLNYGGSLPPIVICGLTAMKIDPPELFAHLSSDCKPIATRSRRYSAEDRAFIEREIQRMLREGIIEESNSPWRAQVVVTKSDHHKKRLVIDFSETINRFTHLDGHPLPRIEDLVKEVASYRYFSSIDLCSAYHQVPLNDKDRPYTAFEACGSLYQFTRLPFGVTNGVASFQRIINSIIRSENLARTYAYLDDLIICGKSKEEHDANLARFMEVAKRRKLTYNDEKCNFSTTKLSILGYVIENGRLRPDPDRLRPLRELPIPSNTKSLRRTLGLFTYYSKWIKGFSDKIHPLRITTSFPISSDAERAFNELKEDIQNSVVTAIDESIPFEVETDASDFAIAATLNQAGRPVAFFSRVFHGPENRQSVIEKEALAIIEAVRHWKHYLTGHHFRLITDQRSVRFMFDKKQRSRIKNDKVMRWRAELSCYDFDIIHRPGEENIPPDVFSRSLCASADTDSHSTKSLMEIHESLCHPGVTRLHHFVRAKNLPYSIDEVRRAVSACRVCAECKSQFYRGDHGRLIKATLPFESLNIDFKGPFVSTNRHKYIIYSPS